MRRKILLLSTLVVLAAPVHAMTAQQACRESGGLAVASCAQWLIEEAFAAIGGW